MQTRRKQSGREPKISPNGRITYYLDTDPHVVYRLYDSAGRLIYIGMTWDLTSRLRWHRRHLRGVWMRCEEEWHANRREASRAERMAILRENPEFNVARY